MRREIRAVASPEWGSYTASGSAQIARVHSLIGSPHGLPYGVCNGDMTATVTPITAAPTSLDAFLSQVERRAYRMALLATKRSADALDVVQDAMLQLVQSYRTRPHDEWPLLFQRILQNKIMDWHRAQTRQRKWFWQAPVPMDEDMEDPIAQIVDERDNNPAQLLERAGDIEAVLAALEKLPLRQQQAFMLRSWEGLDVAQTAIAMECGEGSVKTHYFRAMQALRAALGDESE